jgi:hypothetical protein
VKYEKLGHFSPAAWRAIEMAREGKGRREIAHDLKLSLGYVSSVLSYARRFEHLSKPKAQEQRLTIQSVKVTTRVLALLKDEADKRHISVGFLAERLLLAIVEDDLYAAVLDDRQAD